MLAKVQGPPTEGRAKFSLLLLFPLITISLCGADLPSGRLARNGEVLNSIPCNTMTAAEVLASRYPDPEAFIAPARCKERTRQVVQKWQQEDLDNLQKLAAEACADTVAGQAEWLLKKELVKLERQSILAELSCACSAEILSQATNPPAPPPMMRIVTDVTPRADNSTQNAALTPIRYSAQVLAKKAAVVISHNAAELLSIISGKIVKGLSAAQFDSDLAGQWNNQYRTALRGLVQAAEKLQTLSVELDAGQPAGTPSRAQTTASLPEIVQTLIEQTRLLSLAYEGIVRDRELPWGQCYESFAIRHQLIINSVAPLISKSPSISKTK